MDSCLQLLYITCCELRPRVFEIAAKGVAVAAIAAKGVAIAIGMTACEPVNACARFPTARQQDVGLPSSKATAIIALLSVYTYLQHTHSKTSFCLA